jgi:hypothetical protein
MRPSASTGGRVHTMTTEPDTTESGGVTAPTDDYRRTVLTLRLVKLALGILVSLLTALELVGAV